MTLLDAIEPLSPKDGSRFPGYFKRKYYSISAVGDSIAAIPETIIMEMRFRIQIKVDKYSLRTYHSESEFIEEANRSSLELIC